jgi:hypothetical protein
MIAALIFCPVVAMLATAVTVWCLVTLQEELSGARKDRAQTRADLAIERKLRGQLESRVDAIRMEFDDARVFDQDSAPAPAKKAAPRKAPAAKKGPAK